MANAKRFERALQKLDLLVVIDLFMTRTAEQADMVLPASSCFEKTQLNLKAYSNPATLQNQVIEPAFRTAQPQQAVQLKHAPAEDRHGQDKKYPQPDESTEPEKFSLRRHSSAPLSASNAR